MATATKNDIRPTLPLASKAGTSHKPVWTIDGKEAKFLQPLKKEGVTVKGHKPNMGNKGRRTLARYTAGQTKAGKPLEFVGLFEVQESSAS